MGKFDKDFTKRIVGEDPEHEMTREKQRQARDTRTSPFEIMGIATDKPAHKTKAAPQLTLAQMIGKEMQRKMAADLAHLTSWEDYDSIQDGPVESILDLSSAFQKIISNVSQLGAIDPLVLQEIVRAYRNRLAKIKLKHKAHKSIGEIVSAKMNKNISDDDFIAAELKKIGCTAHTIKFVLG